MRQVQALLLGIAMLLAVAFAAPPIDASAPPPPIVVPVVTKYITTEVTTLQQEEPIVMIGQLCEQPKGMGVHVTIILNNNPDWDPTFGVLWYYVVDDPNKNITAALCTNYPTGVPQANCTVKLWSSASNNIYLKGHAGQSEAVSFTADLEFSSTAQVKSRIVTNTFVKAPVQKRDLPHPVLGNVRTVYLSEIITLQGTQSLGYRKKALLNFTFCPTPQTGTRYVIDVTVTASDGQSSYALYICNKLPCAVDGPNVISFNGRQLPSNNAKTASGSWKTLYALVVCWGGIWNPTQGHYIGNFVFNAHVV